MGKLARIALASILFALPFQAARAQNVLPGAGGPPPAIKGQPNLPPAGKSGDAGPVWTSQKIVPESGPVFVDDGWGGNGGKHDHDEPCFAFYADYLYLQARGADVPFSQSFQGAGLPLPALSVPRGTVDVADPDYGSGFRVGGSWYLNDCQWISATFAYLDTSTHAHGEAIPGNALLPLVAVPQTLFANPFPNAQKSDAVYGIDFRTADLDYHHVLCSSQHYQVSYAAGFRYAHLDQDLNVKYSILGETTVDTTINFDGIGPRVGLEGEYHVGECGLFGYSKGNVGFLAGHFAAKYEQRNLAGGEQATVNIGDDRIVPQAELELGIGWATHNNRIRVMVGYYLGAWFNTLTTNSLVRGVQGEAFNVPNYVTNGDNFRDTLTFDGFVARFEFRY